MLISFPVLLRVFLSFGDILKFDRGSDIPGSVFGSTSNLSNECKWKRRFTTIFFLSLAKISNASGSPKKLQEWFGRLKERRLKFSNFDRRQVVQQVPYTFDQNIEDI